jgi:hypothetical protein
MDTPTIDELLAGSRREYVPSAATKAALDATVADTRAARTFASRRSPRRRAMWLIPGGVVMVGALTAGAIVVDDLLHADLPIPIEYTTDTGIAVSCTAEIEGGSLFARTSDEVIDYYRTHDFEGIGQRIHDYALVLTGDRAPEPGLMPRSSEWIPEEGLSDADAFSYSLTSFLLTDTLIELGITGSGDSWLTSDCSGRLR